MDRKDKIIEVAEYFIKKSQEEVIADPSRSLNALKLQKLLYYAKAWNLVMNEKSVSYGEFQAWIYGPVNPDAYQYFKDFDFSISHPEIEKEKFEDITGEEKEILDMVWGIYGKFDGKYLVNLTHSEEPWLRARQGLDQNSVSQNIITDESMKIYYERRLKEAARA